MCHYLPNLSPQTPRLCSENTLSHGRDLEFMQPSRPPVRLLRYLPIQNVKDALRPKHERRRCGTVGVPGPSALGLRVSEFPALTGGAIHCRAFGPGETRTFWLVVQAE